MPQKGPLELVKATHVRKQESLHTWFFKLRALKETLARLLKHTLQFIVPVSRFLVLGSGFLLVLASWFLVILGSWFLVVLCLWWFLVLGCSWFLVVRDSSTFECLPSNLLVCVYYTNNSSIQSVVHNNECII